MPKWLAVMIGVVTLLIGMGTLTNWGWAVAKDNVEDFITKTVQVQVAAALNERLDKLEAAQQEFVDQQDAIIFRLDEFDPEKVEENNKLLKQLIEELKDERNFDRDGSR